MAVKKGMECAQPWECKARAITIRAGRIPIEVTDDQPVGEPTIEVARVEVAITEGVDDHSTPSPVFVAEGKGTSVQTVPPHRTSTTEKWIQRPVQFVVTRAT